MASRIKSLLKSILPGYQTLHLEYPVHMRPRYGNGLPPHAGLQRIIETNREVYKTWLLKALSHVQQLQTIKDTKATTSPVDPSWNNGFLPGLDIVMLYTMVASNHPADYVEIGSGNSTKVVFKAKKDNGLKTRITSIDPAPRAEIDKLADSVIRMPFEKTDLSFFKELKKGDIVFVDNSHRIFPNSDAMVFFMEVLPSLAQGVIVHLHDIYLPYDYPENMCERYYSEQYGLAAFLLANPLKYRPILPAFFVSEDAELRAILTSFWEMPSMPVVERHGGSFWLEIGE